jgi:UDP-N-acetylmuramoyl-tripeptide--D-alanyl-D-alanine ligase
LKLAGRHNVFNALAAAACSIACGVPLSVIKQGLEQMEPVRGRMQPGRSQQGNVVINDTYNANPESFSAALEALNAAVIGEKWVVMGALGELGKDSPAIHAELGRVFKKLGVSRLFAQGSDSLHTVEAFGLGGQYFDCQEDLIQSLESAVTGQEVLLVKGSRIQKMEKVVAALLPQI